jgi:hypothetical protein
MCFNKLLVALQQFVTHSFCKNLPTIAGVDRGRGTGFALSHGFAAGPAREIVRQTEE